jgi:hypothetical protein
MEVRPIDGNILRKWCEKIIDQACHPATVQIGEVFLDKVRSMPTLTPPNEPLTPKQLREMNEPVWCSCKPIEGGNGYWCLCRYGKIVTPSGNIFDVDKIPHWMFYRRPPEGEEDA